MPHRRACVGSLQCFGVLASHLPSLAKPWRALCLWLGTWLCPSGFSDGLHRLPFYCQDVDGKLVDPVVGEAGPKIRRHCHVRAE